MISAHVVEIVTPKKFILNGLWFGPYSAKASKGKPKRTKKTIVWVHGLTSSIFSMQHVIRALVANDTSVLVFNNRGFGSMNSVKRKVGSKTKSINAGAAHEIFTDCADDIQGAINFARRQGVKNIYVAGHSTGCQKSIYWASRTKGGRGVKGIILVAPVSDYADMVKRVKPARLKKITALARGLVRSGKKHELLPNSAVQMPWGPLVCDAQRFLSLYTPDSKETIFCYEQPNRIPRTLRSVKVPVLTLWAEKDEYADRPAKQVTSWFEKNVISKRSSTVAVPQATHGFKNKEKEVVRTIRSWMNMH